MVKKREKLYLVDGSSYIFRAYYAIQPLSTSKGLPTNALYGFTRMLLKLIKEERPERLAIVFDTVEPTFRDELYPEYKANRKEPPDDLVPQFEYFQPIVDALGVKKMAMPGFEADDLIGTIARRAEKEGYEVVIITGDKDFMQLVDGNIKLYDTMKERWVGREEVKKRFGVDPENVIDVMSLAGDSSDNIPGVSGIGDKGAAALITQFGSLDALLANIAKVSNTRSRTALEKYRDKAMLSRELVTIKCDVPIDIKWDDFEVGNPDPEKTRTLFSELEFFKLMRELIPSEEKPSSTKDIRIVSSAKDLKGLSKDIGTPGAVALYFLEGRGGEDPLYLGIGIAWPDGDAYIPVSHETLEGTANVDGADLSDFLGGLKGGRKLLYDAKEIIKRLKKRGIEFLGEMEDVKLIAYVTNPSLPSDLLTLAQQSLGAFVPGTEKERPKKGKAPRMLTMNEASRQAIELAGFIPELYEKLMDDLRRNKALHSLYEDVERPLMRVLLKMEERGIAVDTKRLEVLSKEYDGKVLALEKDIFKEAGEEFTINSPKQLGHILFEKLGLPSVKKTKTGFSTDAGVLERLASKYELPRLVLDYRSLAKLKSTYIDVLPTLVDSAGRIHTTFNQMVTATGRLSSSDPNMQNIPARTEEGLRIREAFIAPKGSRLISADYSQIELRILAHISGEKDLLDAFENGIDIHSATAARIYGVKTKDVDPEMRRVAKTVNFGILYGQSAYGLSEQLGMDVADADTFIKSYYDGYPRVKKLKEQILSDAKRNGFVETLYGRRRYVPDITSGNQQMKAFAERTAFNAVFQGTAADIIKMAMIELDRALEREFPQASMLLQVHDELVLEAPESMTPDLKKLITEKMCTVVKLKVPLTVDIGVGNNWAECKG